MNLPNNDVEKVKAELLSYLDLGDGWDGYGGSKPNADVVASCVECLDQVNNFGFKLPKTMVSGDGDVCLYWDTLGFYIEIGFEERGSYTYIIVVNDVEVEGDDDCDLEQGLTPQLIKAINEVTEKHACTGP